jgi:hypothetical protein
MLLNYFLMKLHSSEMWFPPWKKMEIANSTVSVARPVKIVTACHAAYRPSMGSKKTRTQSCPKSLHIFWPYSSNINFNTPIHVSRDFSVDIATRYGLDGPRIESRWGRDFPHLSVHTSPGAYPASYKMSTGYLSPPPSAEVKERAELYLYSPSQPSWTALGRTLPFLLPSMPTSS